MSIYYWATIASIGLSLGLLVFVATQWRLFHQREGERRTELFLRFDALEAKIDAIYDFSGQSIGMHEDLGRFDALEAKIDAISDFSEQSIGMHEDLRQYLATTLFDMGDRLSEGEAQLDRVEAAIGAQERGIDGIPNGSSDCSEQTSGLHEELRAYLATTLFEIGDRLSEGEAQLDRIEAAIGAIDFRVP